MINKPPSAIAPRRSQTAISNSFFEGKLCPCSRQRVIAGCLQSPPMERFDVLVRGSGIVGQSLALALSRLGLQVALWPDPVRREGPPDIRAYALNAGSVTLLRSLKVWDALPAHSATPVHDMHIEGDA